MKTLGILANQIHNSHKHKLPYFDAK